MLSRLRKHFGTAGLLVAVVALIAALGGSAVAASGGSGDATASAKRGGGNVNNLIKRESRKFSKRFSLAFSKRFPGPTGPQGFPGLPGAPGADGDDGSDGSDGSDGDDGTSASTEAFAGVKGSCAEGGVTVKSASPDVNVCNGEEGSPWTVDGTLPSNATLTGSWSMSGRRPKGGQAFTAISFPIPLEAALADKGPGGEVHAVNSAGEEFGESGPVDSVCDGSLAAPTAPSGHLCVYFGSMTGLSLISGFVGPEIFRSDLSTQGADVSGAHLRLDVSNEGAGETQDVKAAGTWAVTG